MRSATLLIIGAAALSVAGCPGPTTGPHQIAVGGGGSGSRVLVFIVQPSDAIVSTIIAPAIQVAVEDTLGVIDTTATGGVTLALTAPAGSAVLSGTNPQTLVSGVATFSDLSVNVAGAYTLTATSPSRTNGLSAVFNINP
jgi:hypothetical protein